MAEALAVVGVVTAISSILADFVTLGKDISHAARHLRHARAEVEDVDCELSGFTFLLRTFEQRVGVLAKSNNPFIKAAQKARFTDTLTRHSNMILESTYTILYKLKPLRDDKDYSMLERMTARIRWLFEKVEVQPLKLSLVSIKSSLQLFYHMLLISEKESELQARIQEGHETSELRKKIEALKEELDDWRDRCEIAEANLEGLRLRSASTNPPLSEVSCTIEKLVRRELRRQRRQDHGRGSDASVSSSASPTTGTRSSNTDIVEVLQPRVLHRNRAQSSLRETSVTSSSNISSLGSGQGRSSRRYRHDMRYVPTAMVALKQNRSVERSSSPPYVVVDDNFNPVHVARRAPRLQPRHGSDEE